MSDNQEIGDKKEDENKKTGAALFAEKYQALCDEMGYRIVVSPQYVARDDGSFSTVLQYTIGEIPKQR